jgi:hypothetical protein
MGAVITPIRQWEAEVAHPVLIADDWRQSESQDKDGLLAVEEASAHRFIPAHRSGDFATLEKECRIIATNHRPGRVPFSGPAHVSPYSFPLCSLLLRLGCGFCRTLPESAEVP